MWEERCKKNGRAPLTDAPPRLTVPPYNIASGVLYMNVSILIDGSFFWMKHLEARLGQPPSAESVKQACELIMADSEFENDKLFRAYYYDSPPYGGRAVHPISQREIEFSTTEQHRIKNDYLTQLQRMPRMALRLGSLAMQGWKLNKKNMRGIMESLSRNLPLQPQDVSINLVQKEVDMLMGLDIAWMAARGMVDKVVLLTGDADMIPAMNFAREHGMLVFVAKFGYYLSDKLREHADGVVEFTLPAPERTYTPSARVVSMPPNGGYAHGTNGHAPAPPAASPVPEAAAAPAACAAIIADPAIPDILLEDTPEDPDDHIGNK